MNHNLISRNSLLLTALIAAAFSTIVSLLLIIDAADRLTKIPLDSPEFLQLKEQFADAPNDEALKQQLRDLDLALREEYFREQQFTKTGVFLLLAGIGVMLVTGRLAANLQRKLPMPAVKNTGPDADELLSRRGVWSVAALVLVLIATAWGMNASHPSSLPDSPAELAALLAADEQPPADASIGAPSLDPHMAATDKQPAAKAPQPQLPALPSPEDFRRNWPSFRGPEGSGMSAYAAAPTKWDGTADEGFLWKTAVPLPGVNSPIIWNDRVFLSGATEEKREVYCFDANTGKILWQQPVAKTDAANDTPIKVSEDTGYAAPTMATDGRAVFAIFADGDLAAFDLGGKQLWQRSFGVPKNNYGHAASLVTHNGRVIVQFDQGSAKDELSKLSSFDGVTGEPVWEKSRNVPASWSSPIIALHDGKPLLITAGDPCVIAYNPDSGEEIWRAECLKRAEVGPSPVYADGMVFAGNDNALFAAIRADGSGDVTKTHILWTIDTGLPDTCSPLVVDDFVLLLTSYGTLSCYDKKEGGDPLWEEDLGADFISSPGIAGGNVYVFSTEGKTHILKPTADECQKVAEAELGEECVTSPAFQDGRIYIRGKEHLFCIGKQPSP